MRRPTWRRASKLVGALGLAGMVAGATPAWPAEPTPPPRDTTVFACSAGEVPESGLVDIAGETFELQIECLAWYEITEGGPGGIPADQYGPAQSVTRAQMASFIARSLDHLDPELLPAYDGSNQFTDVADDSPHVAAVNRLAEADIARGGAGGAPATTYSPALPVRRDQMASFIARSLGFVLEADVCVNVRNYFDDDNGNTHEACINGLADIAIVAGTGEGRYSTDASVTRAQMSGFIMRMMDIYVEQELASTPSTPSTTPPSSSVRERVGQTTPQRATPALPVVFTAEPVFAPGSDVEVFFVRALQGAEPTPVGPAVIVGTDGGVTAAFTVPPATPPGIYFVYATGTGVDDGAVRVVSVVIVLAPPASAPGAA